MDKHLESDWILQSSTCAGEDDRLNAVVFGRPVELIGDLLVHFDGERVQFVRPIEPDRFDGVLNGYHQRIAGRR